MEYHVRLLPRAIRDLDSLFLYIRVVQSPAAQKWFNGLTAAILSLNTLPYRWPLAPENSATRHLLYGNKPNIYRVVYTIFEDEGLVEVLHIRHQAQSR